MKFSVRMRSVGNPDFGQYAPISNVVIFHGKSVKACANACREYIRFWNLGGGNWPEAWIKQDGKKVARVSYNGRIWKPDGTEFSL